MGKVNTFETPEMHLYFDADVLDGCLTIIFVGSFPYFKFLTKINSKVRRKQLALGCCLTNISGAQKGKSQKVRGPTGNVLGAAANISKGTQRTFLGALGYWAPVRQQPCGQSLASSRLFWPATGHY